MVFGAFEESCVNSTFNITCGPATTVVTLPCVTRLTHFNSDSSTGTPFITPETMLHSPSNSVAGALLGLGGADFLDEVAWALRVVSPRVRVSNANPLPALEAKREGRTVPRVAMQSFQVSPSSS